MQPARGFAEDFGLVGADLLLQFAQRGLARGLAGIDAALRHLPGRKSRRHVDAAPDKHQPLPVQQHDADPGTVERQFAVGQAHGAPQPLNLAAAGRLGVS